MEKRNGRYFGVNNHLPVTGKLYREFTEIPCNQCIACRINHSRQWIARCLAELKYHDKAYFITLTYNNDNIPTKINTTEEGVIAEIGTLVKKDLQDFWKRLRKKHKVRYYAVGEYGSKSLRPHYHAIVFGLELTDLEWYKRNYNNDDLYTSKELEASWGKGFVTIGEVNAQTIGYTARYCMKKLKDDNLQKYIEHVGIEPPFMTCSQGLGKQYYEENKESLLEYGEMIVEDKEGGKRYGIPRYFKNKLESDYNEEYAMQKEKKTQILKRAERNLLQEAGKRREDYLKDEARRNKIKADKLRRDNSE